MGAAPPTHYGAQTWPATLPVRTATACGAGGWVAAHVEDVTCVGCRAVVRARVRYLAHRPRGCWAMGLFSALIEVAAVNPDPQGFRPLWGAVLAWDGRLLPPAVDPDRRLAARGETRGGVPVEA